MQDATNTRGATPPCTKQQGQKQQHSPWSAPRQRKRRPPAQQVAQSLQSLDEDACWTSPPKRLNGGGSPAARELPLHGSPLGPAFSVPVDVPDAAAGAAREPAGPLAQGLLAPQLGSEPGFSPLASGLAATFAAGSFEWPAAGAPAAPSDKQRRQLRQVAAWRLASQRQRDAVAQQRRAASLDGGPALAPPSAVPAMQGPSSVAPSHPPPGSVFSSLEWQPAIAGRSGAPPMAPQQAQQAQQQAQQQHTGDKQPQRPHQPAAQAPAAAPPSPQARQQQQHEQHAPLAPHPQHHHEGVARPGSRLGSHARTGPSRCSTGQDMETDLRSSWGSERSADVTSWQSLQARLRDEAGQAAHAGRLPSAAAGLAAAIHRQASMASEGCDAAMRGSADCGGSVHSGRSSLDAPSCADRQTSQLPLRSAMRGPAWHSHLASPPEAGGEGASPDPLLGRSSGSSKQRSRGSHPKWGCFSCASPFSCRQRSGVRGDSDDDGEVVRRNAGPRHADTLSPLPPGESEGEEFVIRKGSLSRLGGASPASSGRGSAGRVKHTSLNRPPSGQDLLQRQDAFSARCTPPGAPWSPCADGLGTGSDDGSFSLPSATHGLRSVSVGLRDGSIEELAGYSGGKEAGEGASVDVDALNGMLKALSLCPSAHPKDAEALVAQACADHSIQPNATTARTLEKMWAVHEQLYG